MTGVDNLPRHVFLIPCPCCLRVRTWLFQRKNKKHWSSTKSFKQILQTTSSMEIQHRSALIIIIDGKICHFQTHLSTLVVIAKNTVRKTVSRGRRGRKRDGYYLLYQRVAQTDSSYFEEKLSTRYWRRFTFLLLIFSFFRKLLR